MIITKEVKIKNIKNLSGCYIDNELKKLNLDFINWAIVSIIDDYLILNVSVVEQNDIMSNLNL